MPSTPGIKLTFSCKQDLDAMETTCNGRFCDSCNSEVFDFTGHSINEIKRIREEKGEMCGMFRPEQLDPDLIPIEFNFLQKARYFILAGTTFLGLELTQVSAQVQDRSKIENTLDTCKDRDEFTEAKSDSVTTAINITQKPGHKIRSRNLFRIGRMIVYRSRRFPFIRVRSRGLRGRF